MHIVNTDANGERRRHNGYGVDLIGAPECLDRAFAVLNAHETVVSGLRGVVAFIQDLNRTHCGLADFAGNYPDLERAYPEAIEALQNLGIDPFEER